MNTIYTHKQQYKKIIQKKKQIENECSPNIENLQYLLFFSKFPTRMLYNLIICFNQISVQGNENVYFIISLNREDDDKEITVGAKSCER